MKEKLIALLTFTSSLKSFGMKFIRVAILVVFVWIGGLKYFHYEADGIVPFVANSPFMSFFYAKGAPEYKEHKNAEGAFVPENRAWHEANRTYTFSYGLGALIMSIGILVFLGIFFPKVGLAGDTLAIIMTLGTLSFLVTTPEVARRQRQMCIRDSHYHDARHTFFSCHHPGSLGSRLGKRRIRFPITIRCRAVGD